MLLNEGANFVNSVVYSKLLSMIRAKYHITHKTRIKYQPIKIAET